MFPKNFILVICIGHVGRIGTILDDGERMEDGCLKN